MLAAALRTDSEDSNRTHFNKEKGSSLSLTLVFTDDYKDFGTNCDSMAAEIEDHILHFESLSVRSVAPAVNSKLEYGSNPSQDPSP